MALIPHVTSSHRTALALERMTAALADVSEAIEGTHTISEVYELWRAFAPVAYATVAAQNRMAIKCEQLQVKD